jgi:hypothetical protein
MGHYIILKASCKCSARIENLKQVCYNGKWRTVAELALKDRRQLLVVCWPNRL